jgi:hypothetical protein
MVVFRCRATRLPGLLMLAALLLGACGRAADLPTASAPTVAPPVPTAQPSDRLYIRDGFKGDAERLTIVDSVSGARQRDLPPGVTSPDWSTLYVATQEAGSTRLQALDIASGQILRETKLDGAYGLPMITPDSVLGGLSPDGRWLALQTAQPRTNAKKTQFLVIDTNFTQPPRQANLDGVFLFDGLNNSATSLFLTESLADDPTAKYHVRRYDLAGGALDPNIIVDKLDGTQIMSGVRQTAVASKDGGWLYSLYLNRDHGPFIHALPITDNQGIAFCIDLPTNSKDDLAKQSRWSLLMSGDRRMLYAVNGALGLVVEYSIINGLPEMLRTKALFEAPPKAGGSDAKQPKSTITALAPDGATLYTLGDQGLLVIDVKALSLRGRYLADWALDGLAISPDGARLYAASAFAGKIVRLDPRAGTIVAEVPTDGKPTGVIRVES